MTSSAGITEAPGGAPAERIFALDALRGFALVGIALANVPPLIGTAVRPQTDAERLVADFGAFFVDGRFYPIFAFLFGVGFFVFVRNAERRGGRPRVLFARRLCVLLVFGVAHQFLQPGEALLPYALCGFLLLPLYRVRSSFLLAFSVPFLAAGLALTPVLGVPGLLVVGTVCGRAGVFEHPDDHLEGLRIAGLVFGVLSAAGLGFQWYVSRQTAVGDVVVSDAFSLSAVYAPGPPLAGLYVVVLTLVLYQSPLARRLFRPLAAYGRMALTNYIGATLFFLAGAYALGLVGIANPTPVHGVLLCLALYALQVPLSVWWLSRFRMGPLEWIWRTLTYGKAPSREVEDRKRAPTASSPTRRRHQA